ncbi:MAG: ATP-dependent sacrificial sulfur transferase LarE [Kiritimatiellae bacterium]|nr:ATP-dependent sacrificial sulfur transferase LarE [Kiritimatiellia bacterium]
MTTIQKKLQALEKNLRKMKSLMVAYSGGLDSAFLAVMAAKTLGEKMLAVTVLSPALARRDREDARKIAKTFGFRHETVSLDTTRDKHFAANPANRCYYCKAAVFARLQKMARTRGFKETADGTNLDDLKDYRPGLKAGREHGIRHPLRECGFTKKNVRLAARRIGLSIADKPASPCLASRFPYGTPITPARLKAVDALETKIRALGFSDCRARVESRGIARIEVPENELKLALKPLIRKSILLAAHKTGFSYAVLDLAGLRSGNLNRTMNKNSPQRHRDRREKL